MRKLLLAIGLVGLTLALTTPAAVAGANASASHSLRTGTTCKSPTYTGGGGAPIVLAVTCSNHRVTGGSASTNFDNGFWDPIPITWATGQQTYVAWTMTQVTGTDEHESAAHSCQAIAIFPHDGVIEYDMTGTVTSDGTGGLPVGSTVTAEECVDIDQGIAGMEPGSKLVFS